MSNEKQDPYHFDPSNYYNNHQNLCFEPSSYTMNFTDFLHGSMNYSTFDKSCSSSRAVSPVEHGSPGKVTSALVGDMLERTNNTLISSVHNSSVSSSSTEAATEEDSGKSKRSAPKLGEDHEPHNSQKPNKSEKKEKREKKPRFAFLTKSEIDNLEDGYKWRKYGQKAVKNSSYPRSYYRCTTQKCGMKKRVERSYEDPTVVITTYEGQHNHQCPATLIRGTTNGGAFLPPSSSFLQDFLSQLHHPLRSGGHATSFHRHQPYQQQLQVPDYGMLQDLVIPPFSHQKHEEP